MGKKRAITKEVIQRALKVNDIISEWMYANNIVETNPEECMTILVEKGIYSYDSKGKGYNFREDLRTLRDCNRLDIFTKIKVEQIAPGTKWYIKL